MRIFVSSTFKDLRPERESAQEARRRSELVRWGMELFVSEPSEPLDVCSQQVQLSDAVILIIGFMAGSLIPESPELTYTRAEFEFAQKLGRPVFAFFKTEGAGQLALSDDNEPWHVFFHGLLSTWRAIHASGNDRYFVYREGCGHNS